MFAAALLAQDAARPLWNISGGALVAIVFWMAVASMVIVPSLAHYWAQVRKAEADARLKEQMIARGYSPAEILALLNNNPTALRDIVPSAKGGAMTPSKLPPNTPTCDVGWASQPVQLRRLSWTGWEARPTMKRQYAETAARRRRRTPQASSPY